MNSLNGKNRGTGLPNSISTEISQIRKFGLVAFVSFGCLSALGLWFKRPLATYFFGCLSFLGAGFILLPGPLKPLYTAWITISRTLGRIVTASVLTLAYYLVITPSALIKRLFGGRPLPLVPNKETSTYWVNRAEPVQPRERFLKRF
jgi:hypothetical protein